MMPKEWRYLATEAEADDMPYAVLVEKCFALASKPPNELTDSEINHIGARLRWTPSAELRVFIRECIAAAHNKQRGPEVVKFRAARRIATDNVEMVRVAFGLRLGDGWEWLEPPQEFEVRV